MWDRPGWHEVHQGWWVFGELIPLLFLVAVIVFGIWAVRRITESHRLPVTGPASRGGAGLGRAGMDSAVQELRLRYARGELGRDEFVQRFHDLGGEGLEPPPPPPTGEA
jgi:uncharacterized membrane protein